MDRQLVFDYKRQYRIVKDLMLQTRQKYFSFSLCFPFSLSGNKYTNILTLNVFRKKRKVLPFINDNDVINEIKGMKKPLADANGFVVF